MVPETTFLVIKTATQGVEAAITVTEIIACYQHVCLPTPMLIAHCGSKAQTKVAQSFRADRWPALPAARRPALRAAVNKKNP